ncbi:MAG: hypothetical protein WA993_07650 [Candidatus Binatus sp.]|jgi:NTP pyrophosphatase (non-canonical NTP hydrolase)|uniref:hypothetical protein n=1 Tax=Candidatus Binatus sp. TaxID=2811406 RepID=UPI003C983BC9
MGDLHVIAISKQLVEQTRVKLQLPQPMRVQRSNLQLGFDAAGNPIGDFLGGLFKDVESVATWLAGLAGEFCDAYNKGGTVGNVQVSIKEVLQKAADVLTATGTADGKAVSAAITLVIATLDAACK